MTWRAFIIGLLAVVLIAALAPYNDWDLGNTYITGCHFPPGPFFLLLVLTLGANLLLKLVKKAWALRQPELMLIWCMMIVGSTVPSSGLMRVFFSVQAAPAYFTGQPHHWRVMQELPDSLVPAKRQRAVVVYKFYQGVEEPGWKLLVRYGRRWMPSVARWLVFVMLFYVATLFLGGMLRKQWVESERLIFPLARVPLELTEGSGKEALLPPLVRDKAFLVGFVLTALFAFIQAAPVIAGKDAGWLPSLPIDSVLYGTPLGNMEIWSANIFPLAAGIGFLVPADVALSVWFFFMFTRMELQVSHWIGRPMDGSYGKWMQWQHAGAFIVFFLMMFWSARRHLIAVAKKALGLDRTIDDSAEPISYRVGFLGFLLAIGGMVGWFWFYGMRWLPAVALVALLLCIALIHARLVSQGGIFFTQHTWNPVALMHGITDGRAFAGAGVVVALMQNAMLTQDSREILSGHAMNALRISSVFTKAKRLFLPIMLIALVVAIAVSSVAMLDTIYRVGGESVHNRWGTVDMPKAMVAEAGRMLENPSKSAEAYWWPLGLGGVVMFFVTVMRARFYWWPVHSLGFLIGSTWPTHNLWLGFFIAWFLKVFIMKFGGGHMLKTARSFFLGLIVAEVTAIGVSTLLGLLAGVELGQIYLPT